jgi:hypothetical protein
MHIFVDIHSWVLGLLLRDILFNFYKFLFSRFLDLSPVLECEGILFGKPVCNNLTLSRRHALLYFRTFRYSSLSGEQGRLGLAEFITLMKHQARILYQFFVIQFHCPGRLLLCILQLRRYAQVQLSMKIDNMVSSEETNALLNAIKHILLDQVNYK